MLLPTSHRGSDGQHKDVQAKGAMNTPTKRERDDDEDGTPTKAAKPAVGDRAAGRTAAENASAAAAGMPSDDAEPMLDTDVAACSPRPDVPSDVMDAAAALVSASSGGVHVSYSLNPHLQPSVVSLEGPPKAVCTLDA